MATLEKEQFQSQLNKLQPFFLKEGGTKKFASKFEFLAEYTRLKKLIEKRVRPDDPSENIGANSDLYENALNYLKDTIISQYSETEKDFDRFSSIYLRLKKYFNSIEELIKITEKLNKHYADKPEMLEAIKIAARQRHRELSREKATEIGKGYSVGVYAGLKRVIQDIGKDAAGKLNLPHDEDGNLNHEEVENMASDFIPEAIKQGFINKGWASIEKNPNILFKLFTLALAVDELIEHYRENMDNLKREDLSDLKTGQLQALKKFVKSDDGGGTGLPAEIENFYIQFERRFNALQSQWERNVNEKFGKRAKAENKLDNEELSNYRKFCRSLMSLDEYLSKFRKDGKLRVSVGSLSDTEKDEISKLLEEVENKIYFLNDDELNEDDRSRLNLLYNQLLKEVSIIKGKFTDMDEDIFSDRVRDWFVKNGLFIDLDKIKVMWMLYESGNTDALIDDLVEMKSSQEEIQEALKFIEKMTDEDDVEYHQQVNALMVLMNRLSKMIKAVEAEEETEAASESEGKALTREIVLREEIVNFSSKELIRRARFLWDPLFDGLEMLTDQSKEEFYNKYKSILSLLKTRDKKDKEEAEYLDLRLKFYEVLVVGTSSAWTVDYDAMYEGGSGWNGFKTQAQVTEVQIMELLYGSEMRINTEDISSPEEQEFYESVHNSIKISCELFQGYDPETDEFRGVDGPYHAFNVNYTEKVREKFKITVEQMLLEELQQDDPEKTELTEKEKEAALLANQLTQFLDLRTYYALMTYFVGKSPKSGDPIGTTLSKYSERFGGFKDLYKAIGKNTKGFVITEALVRQIPQSYIDSIEPSPKKNNNLILSIYTTDLYDHFHAGASWDDDVTSDDEKVIYKGSETQNPVPLHCEAYWVPRTRYVKEVYNKIVPATLTEFKDGKARRSTEEDSGISLNTRNAILNAADSPDASGRNIITAKGYLEGAAATEKFVKEAKKAFPISGNPHTDIEKVHEKIVSLAETLSPSKSMAVVEGAIDNRRLANYLLLCIRFSCLAFGEKYAGDEDGKGRAEDYFRLYGRYLAKISSGLSSAATADIRIEEGQLPPAFRKKYGFPNAGPIKISDYVQQLIPQVGEKTFGSSVKLHVPNVSKEVEEHIFNVLSINPIQHKNNQEEFEEHKGEKKRPLEALKDKKDKLFRAGVFRKGEVSPLLHHDVFTPIINGDKRLVYTDGELDMEASRAVFMNAINLPPLIGEKDIKDEDE